METPDYKETTNLPRTGFPMKADLPLREPSLLARWEAEGTYGKLLASARGEPFVLHDGPPYANGPIHQGHMLNKILKDFTSKYWSMAGRPSEVIPGWDCHGLPIELAVDKQLGARRRELSKVALRRECRRHAERFIELQRSEFKRLGVFARWNEPYTTMAFAYEARIVRELAKATREGVVYRGKKPVYWCLHDRTALAEAEVEYDDHDSPSIYVAFRVEGEFLPLPKLAGREVDLAIWTTTPWTLPANLAIAVHPTSQYLVYDLRGRPVVVAADLLSTFLAAVAPAELTQARLAHPERILGYLEGSALEGLRYRHPLFDRVSPVILGDHVTLDLGTGLVHTAPGHGHDDYQVGQRYGLPPTAPVDAAGRFTAEAGPFAGRQVFEANPAIVEALVAAAALLNPAGETVRHSYPHCWRCKRPVILRATDQWFIRMDSPSGDPRPGLRQRAMAALDRVDWIPAWGRDRIASMVERRPDWCISRQRAWGVPIPAFYCEGCGKTLLDPALLERIADRFEREGADAWFEHSAEELLPEGQSCPGCGAQSFSKEEDILDVWFDSGVSYAAVLEARGLRLPADLYLEGSDQHRGWFQSSLMCALATGRDEAPYRSCLTHGFVVDGQGRKLSKSLGNYLDLAGTLKQQGAELIRLWVAAEDYRDDIRLSPEIVARLSDGYRKLRNTLRFGLANLYDFDPSRDRVPHAQLPRLDRYFRARLHRWVERARAAYEVYEFHQVFRSAMDLCTVELSALYFDIAKDRLYCSAPGDPARRSAQTVLYEVVELLCRALAPILSFTCEEAYGYLPGHLESVFLAGFPIPDATLFDEPLERDFTALLALRRDAHLALEPLRRDKRIRSSQEAHLEIQTERPELKAALSGDRESLAELFIVSTVELCDRPPAEGQVGAASGATLALRRADGGRCARCWYLRPEVIPDVQPLCHRCQAVVLGLTASEPNHPKEF